MKNIFLFPLLVILFHLPANAQRDTTKEYKPDFRGFEMREGITVVNLSKLNHAFDTMGVSTGNRFITFAAGFTSGKKRLHSAIQFLLSSNLTDDSAKALLKIKQYGIDEMIWYDVIQTNHFRLPIGAGLGLRYSYSTYTYGTSTFNGLAKGDIHSIHFTDLNAGVMAGINPEYQLSVKNPNNPFYIGVRADYFLPIDQDQWKVANGPYLSNMPKDWMSAWSVMITLGTRIKTK